MKVSNFRLKTVMATAVLVSWFFMRTTSLCYGAIPLITDDTGTQGKGKVQIEALGGYTYDKEEGIKSEENVIATALTYGIVDPVDITLFLLYQSWSIDGKSFTERENGLSDLAMEVKWRFFEKEGFSFALKPGLTLPTGNEKKGLGAGKSIYYIYFIGSKELKPWSFNANVVYIRNENKIDERRDLWSVSLATTVEITKGFKLVADTGVESNPDKSSDVLPAWILGGFIYSPMENFDIGLGLKGGLTKPASDITIRGGLTWRY